jgi:FtsP/CotA-like multicopper oxidase with cupredoxin domain
MTPRNFLALCTLPFVCAAAAQDPVPAWTEFRFPICSVGNSLAARLVKRAALPPAVCSPPPTAFASLPSVGIGADTSVDLRIGYDATSRRLCYVSTHNTLPPVLRVGTGHTLRVALANTLQNDAANNATINCPIQIFGGEGLCLRLPHFAAKPGTDATYYPIEANQAHSADGTTNLHVHGLFVSPTACSDEVINTAVYPANWSTATVSPPPCQPTADTITYTYTLPPEHPAGLYWYHTHRHGEAEQETQMGLAGAIVVEDAGDAWRTSIGVTDEVLLVNDFPIPGCSDGVECNTARRMTARATVDRRAVARAMAHASAITPPGLDPRIDQADQAGECAQGATGAAGGTQLWNLTLNGALVPENTGGNFPPDTSVLAKTMQPGQRQIFRLVNASADSFVAPKLRLVQDGVTTIQNLELIGVDGVGIANPKGTRHLKFFDSSRASFVVPPAGRVEFVVHAPPAGATLYLDSDQVFPGCGGNLYPQRRLLKITSAGTPVDAGPPDDSDLMLHTPSLAPYFATLLDPASVHRTFVLAEYTRDFTYAHTSWLTGPPKPGDYNPGATDFYIVQTAADDGEVRPASTALAPFVPSVGQPSVTVHLHGKTRVTEEWLIENSTLETHDFHMHQIHFLDITTPAAPGFMPPVLDTITVPHAPLVGNVAHGYPGTPGWVRLSLTFTQQDIGEFVFHCHILEHEDNGMMAKIRVVAD